MELVKINDNNNNDNDNANNDSDNDNGTLDLIIEKLRASNTSWPERK